MRLLTILLALVSVMFVNISNAQSTAKPTTKSTTKTTSKSTTSAGTITDEDLRKYAIAMDSVKGMQLTLNDIIAEMVQRNTVMPVQRYNELFKVADDQAKLAEKKATPAEIAFLKECADKRAEEMVRVNATYQALVKEYVGVKTFNTIKKSLTSDESLKAKYEAISKEIESKSAASESKGGE
jgi:hypothetical protein